MSPSRLNAFAVGFICPLFVMALQEPTADWKQRHRLEDRFEGFDVDRSVGQGGLRLVAFHASHDPIDFGQDRSITVRFFSWRAGSYQVIAREKKPSSVKYYMETLTQQAQVGLNEWKKWTTAILRSAKPTIDADNIGVVVHLPRPGEQQRSDGGDVAPAMMTRAGSPLASHVSSYDATFLTDTNVAKVWFGLYEGCAAKEPSLEQHRFGNQYTGDSVTVTFKNLKPGLLTLRVSYKVDAAGASQTRDVDYCFWHVPSPADPRPVPMGSP